MRIERECGILSIGQQETLADANGILLRTSDGEEYLFPATIAEIQALGEEGLMFKNLRMTISLELDTVQAKEKT